MQVAEKQRRRLQLRTPTYPNRLAKPQPQRTAGRKRSSRLHPAGDHRLGLEVQLQHRNLPRLGLGPGSAAAAGVADLLAADRPAVPRCDCDGEV